MLVVRSPPQKKLEVNQLNLLNMLLVEYEDLFKEPTILPPPKTHDHSIILKPQYEPFNAQAYKYPPTQKTEIESVIYLHRVSPKGSVKSSHKTPSDS